MDNLIGITGRFGSGKSLYALEWGLRIANKYHKKLITNFPVNRSAISAYCRAMGFNWFAANGRIIQIELADGLMGLWHIPHRSGHILNRHSVTIFDEAGFLVNARSWSSQPKEFGKYLFQVRKLDVHLIVIFQFPDQIDKQIRSCFQQWIVCKSFALYDISIRKPRVYQRIIYKYDSDNFAKLDGNTRAKANIIMPWVWASSVDFEFTWFLYIFYFLTNLLHTLLSAFGLKLSKPVSPISLIFKCFDSGRLVGGEVPVKVLPHKLYSESDYQSYLSVSKVYNFPVHRFTVNRKTN